MMMSGNGSGCAAILCGKAWSRVRLCRHVVERLVRECGFAAIMSGKAAPFPQANNSSGATPRQWRRSRGSKITLTERRSLSAHHGGEAASWPSKNTASAHHGGEAASGQKHGFRLIMAAKPQVGRAKTHAFR